MLAGKFDVTISALEKWLGVSAEFHRYLVMEIFCQER